MESHSYSSAKNPSSVVLPEAQTTTPMPACSHDGDCMDIDIIDDQSCAPKSPPPAPAGIEKDENQPTELSLGSSSIGLGLKRIRIIAAILFVIIMITATIFATTITQPGTSPSQSPPIALRGIASGSGSCVWDTDCGDYGFCDYLHDPYQTTCSCSNGYYGSHCQTPPTWIPFSPSLPDYSIRTISPPELISGTVVVVSFEYQGFIGIGAELKISLITATPTPTNPTPIVIPSPSFQIQPTVPDTLNSVTLSFTIPDCAASTTAYFQIEVVPNPNLPTQPPSFTSRTVAHTIRGLVWATPPNSTTACWDTCDDGVSLCEIPCGNGYKYSQIQTCRLQNGNDINSIDWSWSGRLDDVKCTPILGPKLTPIQGLPCQHPTNPVCRFVWSVGHFALNPVGGDESCTKRCTATPPGTRTWQAPWASVCKDLNDLTADPSITNQQKWFCDPTQVPDPTRCNSHSCNPTPWFTTKPYWAGRGFTPCIGPDTHYVGCDAVGQMTGIMSPIAKPSCREASNLSPKWYADDVCINSTLPEAGPRPTSFPCVQWEGCTTSAPLLLNGPGGTFDPTVYNPPQWLNYPRQ